MQSSQKWIISFILVVLVGVGTFSYTNPELFQGRFTGTKLKTGTTYATLEPKGGKITTSTVTLADLDLTAADDVDNPMDAYDLSWVTVGYWDLDIAKGFSTCESETIVADFGAESSSIAMALGGISQEVRLVVRDAAGKTMDVIEADPLSLEFTPPKNYTGKVQLQLDIRPEDLLTIPGPSYDNTALRFYISRFCVQDSEGGKYYYDSKDQMSQNKYFKVSKDAQSYGVQGGSITFVE